MRLNTICYCLCDCCCCCCHQILDEEQSTPVKKVCTHLYTLINSSYLWHCFHDVHQATVIHTSTHAACMLYAVTFTSYRLILHMYAHANKRCFYTVYTALRCTQVALLTLFFVTVLALNLVKGGGGISSPLGITCGSASFWTLTGATFAWVIAVSYITQRHLVARYHKKNEVSQLVHGASRLSCFVCAVLHDVVVVGRECVQHAVQQHSTVLYALSGCLNDLRKKVHDCL
jgi:hypothetical protein